MLWFHLLSLARIALITIGVAAWDTSRTARHFRLFTCLCERCGPTPRGRILLLVQNTTALYDALCGALRKSFSEGGHLALTAALHAQTPCCIVDAVSRLTPDEALAVFMWLDNARASSAISLLDHDLAAYILRHLPSGRASSLENSLLN